METSRLIEGLIEYAGLVVLLTFHEVGHAWMAWKCGDDTAKRQGRISLNPLVHMDLVGTVILPLLMIFLSMSGSHLGRFLVGWAKPVPVQIQRLRNPRLDDILVSLAGPWMNLALALVLMGVARVGFELHSAYAVELCANMARLSLMLCFFNLLPIPPLDGSQVVRALSGMSYAAYLSLARYGFIVLILVLQVPFVRSLLHNVTLKSWTIIAGWFGVPTLL